jgi:hypothetical protein
VGPVCQREGALEGGRLAGGAGSLVRERESERSGCARAVACRQWAERGERGREGGAAATAWAKTSPAREGRVFSFTFYFPIPISIFVSFSF